MSDREENFREKLEEVRMKIEQLTNENEFLQREFEEKCQKFEERNERDLFELREQNITEVQGIKAECLHVDGQLNFAKKAEEKLKDEKNKKAEEAKQMDDELER